MDDPLQAYKAYTLEKMLRRAEADKTLEALLPALAVAWIIAIGLVMRFWLSS